MNGHISINPKVCHGQACIKGTRIPVHQIVHMLANGDTIEDLLKDYPSLKRNEALMSRLNERQKQVVTSGIKDISRKEYSELVKCSIRTAANDLKDLLSKNIVKKAGAGKYLRYIIR